LGSARFKPNRCINPNRAGHDSTRIKQTEQVVAAE